MARKKTKKREISDEQLKTMNKEAKRECKKDKTNKYFVPGQRIHYIRKAHCRRKPGTSHAAVYRDFGPDAPLRYTSQAVERRAERRASGQEMAI